jgi:hypothetical protein
VTGAKTSLPPELDVELRVALTKALRRNPLVLSADTVLALIAPVIDRFVREQKAAELRRIADFIWEPDSDAYSALVDRADEIEGGA